MINKISFRNYKSFQELQEIEIKPITILIGKNSSGKSAIAKLPTLIDVSLSGQYEEPLLYVNKDVELGAEFRDLIYGRQIGSLDLTLESKTDTLFVEVTSGVKDNDLPKIRKWKLIYHMTMEKKFTLMKFHKKKGIISLMVLYC
jgi:predicted ATPase